MAPADPESQARGSDAPVLSDQLDPRTPPSTAALAADSPDSGAGGGRRGRSAQRERGCMRLALVLNEEHVALSGRIDCVATVANFGITA